MGQYGNQPDFGTKVITIEPIGDPSSGLPVQSYPPGALYIGTSGDILVEVVGGDTGLTGSTFGFTLLKNVPSGVVLPIIVTRVFATLEGVPVTTASDIVLIY
jgi:hypothetical protein